MPVITNELLDFIKHFEGCRTEPYLCPAGYWTIGYGHLLKYNDNKRPDSATIMAWFKHDVLLAANAVERLISVPLNQNQFSALVSFTFNLGGGALQRSSLRRVLNRAEYDAAPDEIRKWVWAGGHKLPGLIKRRNAEAGLYCGR